MLLPLMLSVAACGDSGGAKPSDPAPDISAAATHAAEEGEHVAGVVFRPAPRIARRQCRATARDLGFAVLCPDMLPEHSEATRLGCRGSGHADDLIGTGCRGFRSWQFASIDTDTDHLVIQAAPTAMPPREFLFYPDRPNPAPVRRIGERHLNGRKGTIYAVGTWQGAALSGHTVLVWQGRGHTYGFGFHGAGKRVAALNDFLVEHLHLVSPGGRSRLLVRAEAASPGSP